MASCSSPSNEVRSPVVGDDDDVHVAALDRRAALDAGRAHRRDSIVAGDRRGPGVVGSMPRVRCRRRPTAARRGTPTDVTAAAAGRFAGGIGRRPPTSGPSASRWSRRRSRIQLDSTPGHDYLLFSTDGISWSTTDLATVGAPANASYRSASPSGPITLSVDYETIGATVAGPQKITTVLGTPQR